MSNTPCNISYGRMKLGEYVCQRLYYAGCRDVFGVPGDFNLGFLDKVIESPLNYVGCCNELNAAYAADGYARLIGLGCCMTTYAVGELSAINGVAGAYAECVPVIKIAGGPARKFFKDMPLLHHTLGDYMTPYKMYMPITVDQCVLNDPRFAARDLERVIRNCLLYKRPVYVLIPSDMVEVEIDLTEGIPSGNYDIEGGCSSPSMPRPVMVSVTNIEEPTSNASSLEEAIEDVVSRLQKAKKPVFLPGVELIRRGLQGLFEKLTNKSHIPYATMLLSKGLLREDHPHFMGLYMGARSSPEVKSAIAESDCIVIIGEKLTDFNTGGFTSDFKTKSRIIVNFDEVLISNYSYRHVYIGEFLQGLLEAVPVFPDPAYEYPKAPLRCPNRRNLTISTEAGASLSMKYVFQKLAKVLPDNCVLMAETGASMFCAAETMLPPGATYIGQTFYGSIGYTVGACLGACIGVNTQKILHEERHGPNTFPDRRVILSVGDGSFQLTAQEVSTMIRYKCSPIILLVNNDGYTIERVITDNIYNNIQQWDYSLLPKVFRGNEGIRAKTQGEFNSALDYASSHTDELVFIEVMLDRWDCNKLLKAAGRMMALNNDLNPSMTEEMIQACENQPF